MKTRILMTYALAALAVLATANPPDVTIPKGTPVTLVFEQSASSKSIKAGDRVQLAVKDNVVWNSRVILKKGTPVIAIVSKVDKRKRYGINAQLRFALNPVKSVYGQMINLEPRQKGNVVGGKTAEAGAATAGGVILLGPVGLIGGYFVVGKEVNIKPGDVLETEFSKDVRLSNG